MESSSMRPNPLKGSAQQRDLLDVALDAYVNWREECIAVQDAYRTWARASATDAEVAFHDYEAALYREEHAANIYAGCMGRVGDFVEIGLARTCRAGS
jgi:hypothetical protein